MSSEEAKMASNEESYPITYHVDSPPTLTAAGASAAAAHRGSITGVLAEEGEIRNLKSVGSFDSTGNRQRLGSSESSSTAASQNPSANRQRLYSEEDEEIRVAKAMALAIQNNPNLSADEVRKMVGGDSQQRQQVQYLLEKQKQQHDPLRSIAQAFQASFKDDHHQGTGDVANFFDSMNMSFQESIKKTQEKAKERMQAIVGSASVATSPPSAPKEAVSASAHSSSTTLLPPLIPLSSKATTITTVASDDTQDSQIKLSAVVWKRRSGLGKYNKVAWERRRIILKGKTLQYFKNTEDYLIGDESNDAGLEEAESFDPPLPTPLSIKTPTWLEQAALNLEKAKANMNSLVNKDADDDPNAPRGSLNLIKERATVGAALGHSGAPTPFCLSVKIRGETRWKLCFDDHKTQMEWLAALTDVVVQSSVENFKSAPGADSPEWSLDEYTIRSSLCDKANLPDDDEVEEDDGNVDDRMVSRGGEFDGEVRELLEASIPSASDEGKAVLKRSRSSLNKSSSSAFWTLSETDLVLAAAIINTALLCSHASFTTPSRFWHIATFTNISLWFLLSKQQQGCDGGCRKKKTTSKKTARVPVPISRNIPSSERLKVDRFKPLAGSSALKLESHGADPIKNGHVFTGWMPGPTLQVRSHGYLSTKQKIPSPGTLYELVAVDVFESPCRYSDIAKRVVLPECNFHDDGPKTWHAPDTFVISIALPMDPPSAFGGSKEDGGGFTITMYLQMRKDVRDILRRVTAQGYDQSKEPKPDNVQTSRVNAVKLLEEWCRRAPTDSKFFTRFKMVVQGTNVKELGIPGWILKYNGKPFLIKRPGLTGFLYNHPDQSTMEFDVSLHPFPYLAKQAICYLKDNFFKKAVIAFGFVIEGRSDEELPECVLGTVQLCYPDASQQIQAGDLFGGRSPSSHDSVER